MKMLFLGNDYLSRDSLRSFHLRITNWKRAGYPRHHLLIPAVAKVVNEKLKLAMSVDEMSIILSKEVFGKSANNERQLALKNALKSFLLLNTPSESKKNKIDEYSDKLLKAMMKHPNFNPMSEQVLVHSCVEHSNAFEDLTSQFKPSVLVYKSINSRFMGILRKHQQQIPGKNWIDEYAVYSEHSVKQGNKVIVSFPPFDFDLLKLTESDDTTLVSEKLKILLWAVTGENLFDEQSYQSEMERAFLRVNPKFFICSLVLYYLYRCEKILDLAEIDLFVTMFVILDSESNLVTNEIRARPNYNAVHLATVFNRGVQTIGRVASVFGTILPSFSSAHHNFFDGVLFQKIFVGEIKVDKSIESDRAKTTRAAIFDFMNFKA